MSLHISPAMMETAYEFLRATPPFRGWKMPPADDVAFRVMRAGDYRGLYHRENGQHIISISGKWIGHSATLLAVMAHEMIHLHQAVRGLETGNTEHNAQFHRLAGRVCKLHGFDPKGF